MTKSCDNTGKIKLILNVKSAYNGVYEKVYIFYMLKLSACEYMYKNF